MSESPAATSESAGEGVAHVGLEVERSYPSHGHVYTRMESAGKDVTR